MKQAIAFALLLSTACLLCGFQQQGILAPILQGAPTVVGPCTSPCIQTTGTGGFNSGSAITISATSAGDTIVVNQLLDSNAQTITTPTTTSGTWTQVFNSTCGPGTKSCAQYVLLNCPAGLTTVTTHTSGGITQVALVAEFSGGRTAVDQTGTISTGQSSPYSSPTITTTQASETLIGWMGDGVGTQHAWVGTSGWTVNGDQFFSTFDEVGMAYRVVSSTGTYGNTGTFTGGSANNVSVVASLK